MSDRVIFPDMALFKREVTDRSLVALREIYRIHPAYAYNDDPSLTQIHIEPTYGNLTFEGENPQMLVKIGQYEFALQDYLGMNLAGPQPNVNGVDGGFYSLKDMTTVISITIKAYAEEESSDIADELVMLGTYAARHMFNQVGIIVQGSAVSETQEIDTSKNIYQTIVSFSVNVPWQLSLTTSKPGAIPGQTINLPPINNGNYVPPGVYTTLLKDSQNK